MILVLSYLGDQVLYWSFDTLDNLITMVRLQQVDFDPRVLGKVDIQYIDFQFMYLNIWVHMCRNINTRS